MIEEIPAYQYQEMIRLHYSGAMSEAGAYSALAIQTVAVLIGGLILWRASNYMHKRKLKERTSNQFFQTPYSKGWKRK